MDADLLTGWLSVDPMADKYPSLSPYNYCAWNPIKLVDPNGMDWYVPEGATTPVYDKNVTANNIPDGGTYIGTTAHWFGQTRNDMQYYYHGESDGNITMQDMTVTITASRINKPAQIFGKTVINFEKQINKHSGDISYASTRKLYFRTDKGGLFRGNQYVSTRLVSKTIVGKACKGVPYIGAVLDAYEMMTSVHEYGWKSRETASKLGGIGGSIVTGAALGGAIGGGIPGAIIGGVVGGILDDEMGSILSGFIYDTLK